MYNIAAGHAIATAKRRRGETLWESRACGAVEPGLHEKRGQGEPNLGPV